MQSLGPVSRPQAWLLVIPLVVSLGAAAQVQNGVITGVVADTSGAVVPNASVVVRNVTTGYQVHLETNDLGIYTAQELNVGIYMVRVEASGFKASRASDVVLNAGTVLRVDFKLNLGDVSETVEVTGAVAPVNTESSRLSQIIDSVHIANLPLNGRLRPDPAGAGSGKRYRRDV